MSPRTGGIFLVPLLLVVVLCIESNAALQLNDECQTPDGKQGTCVRLRSCQSIRGLLLKKDKTTTEWEFLKKAQCGMENRAVLTCCPLSVRLTGRFDDQVELPAPGVCGTTLNDRIVGGEEAPLGSYPWLARIQYFKSNNRYGFHCGGVLIHNKYVLTAAHCIEGVPSSWIVYQVRLGEHDTTTEVDCEPSQPGTEPDCADKVVDVLISAYVVHPDYYKENGADYNDIALLQLQESVTFTSYITPICLPTTQRVRSENLTGKQLTVAGWGQTQNRSTSTKLLHLKVPVWENDNCGEVFRSVSLDIVPTQVCAGGDMGKDSCRGDSGGPLMWLRRSEWYLVGLVSFGLEQCGANGVPGVYTRISEYMNWIQETME
uniref:CLIP domain-containing serine protease n=1 Tax=Anopheles atroparvus TaxID=41427 RepID=A0AAG5CTE4_ANOAO